MKARVAEAAREIDSARAALATIEREENVARLELVRAEIRATEAEGVKIGPACRDALWALAKRQRERVAEAHRLEKALAPADPFAGTTDLSLLARVSRDNIVSAVGDLFARGVFTSEPAKRRPDDSE